MNISLSRLKSFLGVARAKSLREASEVLGITQPALSKQIAQLEQDIGRPLFLRHGRGMALTSAGKALIDAIGPSVDHIESAMHIARDHDLRESGHLRVTALSTFATYFVPQAVAILHAQYPRVRLSVMVNNSVEVVEMIERGKADLGVVYDVSVDTDAFVVTPLHEERVAAFAKTGEFGLDADCNLDNEWLSRLPLLLPPQPFALRRILERECGETLHPVAECTTSDMVLRLASLGVGVALLPEPMPYELIEACGLQRIRLLGGNITRRVVSIHRMEDRDNELINEAVKALQASLNP